MWNSGTKHIEVEVDGETFQGQYEVSSLSPPLCELVVWFRGKAEFEQIADHGADYHELCARESLVQMVKQCHNR